MLAAGAFALLVLSHFSFDYVSVGSSDVFIESRYCEPFLNGEVRKIQVKIFKRKFPQCTVLQPEKATFWVRAQEFDSLEVYLCVQKFSPCNTTENAQGCRCVYTNSEEIVVEYNFRFNRSKHEGMRLELGTDCVGVWLDRTLCGYLSEGISNRCMFVCPCLSVCLSPSALIHSCC